MITIYSRGQLGNQMFQFAFAFSLARKIKTFFLIEKIDTKDALNYFTLAKSKYSIGYTISVLFYYCKLYFHPRLYKVLLKALQILTKSSVTILEDSCWENPTENITLATRNGIYKGYFQSLSYFIDDVEDIKAIFTIKKIYRKEFESKFLDIFSKKVLAIHVRRNDYIKLKDEKLGGEDFSLQMSYYENALKTIKDIEKYQICIVGDDLEFIRKNFEYIKDKVLISESEIVDFQVIQNADIAIIANSTFAWWAAFLNPKKHKKIIAPKNWLGFKIQKEFPCGISNDLDWMFIET